MSESLWIIDPDPTSAQALRNAVDLLGPSVETFASVPTEGAAPQAVLIAGVVAEEVLVQWIGELRRLGGNDLLPVTLVGGLESSAQALALGADHYLNARSSSQTCGITCAASSTWQRRTSPSACCRSIAAPHEARLSLRSNRLLTASRQDARADSGRRRALRGRANGAS